MLFAYFLSFGAFLRELNKDVYKVQKSRYSFVQIIINVAWLLIVTRIEANAFRMDAVTCYFLIRLAIKSMRARKA